MFISPHSLFLTRNFKREGIWLPRKLRPQPHTARGPLWSAFAWGWDTEAAGWGGSQAAEKSEVEGRVAQWRVSVGAITSGANWGRGTAAGLWARISQAPQGFEG